MVAAAENISVPEEPRATREIETEVTPGMIEAGKLVLSSPKNETKSLEDSVGEIYVAMAAEDHAAISEQNQVFQVRKSNRIKVWLYCGALAMFILGVGLLVIKIVVTF